MSLAACAVEIRTTGNDANAGAFADGGVGVDYTQQDNPQVTLDGSTITGSTAGASATVTVTGISVSANWVDNHVQVTGGINFTVGLFRVISVDTGLNTVTFDRNIASGVGSGLVAKLGGAMASLGGATKFLTAISGVKYYIKAGTFAWTAGSTANVANGPAIIQAGATNNRAAIIGYDQTRGDFTGTRPIIQFSGSAVPAGTNALINLMAGINVFNIELNTSGVSVTHNAIFSQSFGGHIISFCAVHGPGTAGSNMAFAHTGGSSSSDTSVVVNCEVYNYATGIASFNSVDNFIHDCNLAYSPTGFQGWVVSGTIFANNVSNTSAITTGGVFVNCTAYGASAGANFSWGGTGVAAGMFLNCVSYGAATFNYAITRPFVNQPTPPFFVNCAEGGLGANGFNTNVASLAKLNCQSNISDPFVNKAGNNFGLNNTAGAGALLRDAAQPGVFFGLSTPTNTESHLDMGAVQHDDPTLPDPANVLSGVQYGDAGTEFTGTLAQNIYGQTQTM